MKRKREVQACEEGYTFFEMVRNRQKRLERYGGVTKRKKEIESLSERKTLKKKQINGK